MVEPLSVLVTRWTLRFEGVPPELTPARLRGALLRTYRRMVCPRPRWNHDCWRCDMLGECSYGAVFAARPPDVAVLRRIRSLPRPYLFRTDPIRRDRFVLVLVGSTARLLPRIVRIFERLTARGLTPEAPPGRLERVEVLEPDGGVSDAPGSGPRPLPLTAWLTDLTRPSTLRLEVISPTEIRARGRMVRDGAPGPFLCRLRDRLSSLSAAWCGGPPAWDYDALGELAHRIVVRSSRISWAERTRRSGTTGRRYPASGFLGTMEWAFVDPLLLPLLAAGELLGVGRHCAFGNGWFRVRDAGSGAPLAPAIHRVWQGEGAG